MNDLIKLISKIPFVLAVQNGNNIFQKNTSRCFIRLSRISIDLKTFECPRYYIKYANLLTDFFAIASNSSAIESTCVVIFEVSS